MQYSYEFKKKCVDEYRLGHYIDGPENVTREAFKKRVRIWARMVDTQGPEVLRPRTKPRKWSADQKLQIINQVTHGKTIELVAIENGIYSGQLGTWVHNYEKLGYNGLMNGRRQNMVLRPPRKKANIHNPRIRNETEHEELLRLRKENKLIKAEIAVIKKEIALREEREAARLKAKKQQSSKNSAKKDMS